VTDQDLLRLDSEHRIRALDLTSFIVEAPAGAGKTELLTQRYLKLLTVVNAPEEIVAITFTNKAAAEMRGRVLNSLQDAAEQSPVTHAHKQLTRELALAALARSADKGWHLLTQPARLRINTIDSLSSMLARQMPLMSRFGAQPNVVDDASALYAEAAKRAIAMLEGEAVSPNAPIHMALRYFDNDMQRLSAQLADMLARRDQWLHHTGQSAEQQSRAAFRHLIEHDLRAACAAIPDDLQQKLMPVVRYAASHLPCEHCVSLLLDWETPIQPRLEALPMWQALADVLLTQSGELRKERGINIKNGFPATDEGKAYKQALLDSMSLITDVSAIARVRSLPSLTETQNDWQIIEALSTLLKLAAAHLITVFQESGEVDFVEVSQRALTALGDATNPTDLALRLDYRIQHLLVDEFQDTSPSQVALLERLTMGWQPGDGRTIFCVGDPMQSIYRFRKADVGLFLEVARHGIGDLLLERLQLTRNNRSCPVVIDWINSTFPAVFPAHDSVTRGAIHYRHFAATREAQAGDGVFVHPLIGPKNASADALAEIEAEHLVQLIAQERQQYPAYKIAVLVRARSHLQALVSALRRNRPELRFQAVEVEGLADRQAVQDVLALTHAMLHRADRVNWLAVLRAPWCGLLLADLHRLAADDHTSTLWQLMQDSDRINSLSADGATRLLHVREVFAEAFAAQGRQSRRQWLESTWIRLGGPATLWDTGDVRDIQAFFDLVEKLDAAGWFDLDQLDDEVAGLYAAPDVHADDTLQFMTIHKSKGLEFDTVIMPGLHRQPNKQDTPLLLWEELAIDDASPQLAAAAWRPKHLASEQVTAYDFLQGLEAERSRNESARVLYVGVTRAIHRLHLAGALKAADDGAVKPLNGTFLDMLWHAVGAHFLQAAALDPEPQVTHTDLSDATFTPKLIRLVSPCIPAQLKGDDAQATHAGSYQQPNALAVTTLEASIGSLIHLYMELIAKQGIAQWQPQKLQSLLPQMAYWLARAGHASEDAAAGAQQVLAALSKTLESAAGQWLLQPHEASAAELALSNHAQQQYATHVIDRTFILSGERWIIDYKSASQVTDMPLAQLPAIALRYQAQLDRYAGLFAAEGLRVRKAVFFLRIGEIVELS